MQKTIDPYLRLDIPQVELVKLSSRGLLGADYRQFAKRASEELAHKIASWRLSDGDVPVHCVALGTTEGTGPNRNGDGFRAAVCRKYHPTFVKFAKAYRNHANKPGDPYYGYVKHSTFNEPMQRIELITIYNGNKEAADRNGGFVADDELNTLEQGGTFDLSMSCSVSHDICSGCGNKAKNRRQYCGPEMCKYGGLRDNLGKAFADGHVLHADNPDPTFFDITNIPESSRGADRIAVALGKAAGEQRIVSGAELAEEYDVYDPVGSCRSTLYDQQQAGRLVSIAQQLAAVEKHAKLIMPAYQHSMQPPTDGLERFQKYAEMVLAEAAAQRCMLPLIDFLVLTTGRPAQAYEKQAEETRYCLRRGFAAVADGSDFLDYLAVPFFKSAAGSLTELKAISKLLQDNLTKWSIDNGFVQRRLYRNLLQQGSLPPLKKQATLQQASLRSQQLAMTYMAYQTAVVDTIGASSDVLRQLISHNSV